MTASAHDRIAAEARELLSAGDLAPDDPVTVTMAVRSRAADYQDRAHRGLEEYPLLDLERTIREIAAEIGGYGALEALLGTTGVEDVIVEGAGVRAIRGGLVDPLSTPTTEAANRHTVDRLLAAAGAPALSPATPHIDGVQVDLGGPGHDPANTDPAAHASCRKGRLAAYVPPASPHLSADIRVFGGRHGDLSEMVEADMISPAAANFLLVTMWGLGGILIGGATGTRKSTTLVALLRHAWSFHLLRLVEEAYELDIDISFGGRYQCAAGEDLAGLVQGMLRMRADMIAVGEVRGAECWDLAQAVSSGVGWLSTIHAASARGALERLIQLSQLASPNLSRAAVRDTFADSLDVVVHCERTHGAEDYLAGVTEIATVDPSVTANRFSSTPIFARASLTEPLKWTNSMPEGRLADRLERLLPAGMRTLTDLFTSKELIA